MPLRPVLTNSLAACVAVTVILQGAPARADDPIAQITSDRIARYLTGRAFDRHEDDVSRKTIKDPFNTVKVEICRGHERWVDGAIDAATVKGKMEGFAYQGTIELNYHAKYHMKNFTGAFCEHVDERKSPTGRIRVGIRLGIGTAAITEYTVLSSDPSTAHDSTRMSVKAIEDQVSAMSGNL
ncbi:hypothetical protein QLQ12_35635 [Actinoplanes sp. NEAU-A12]|uniref:Uncharacterized protein n=1 Tax=Actinoplanes sandaracinus TaxID=3045177 RepID=A0ABT6WW33_9ACTN|nr:hypothetical protein [Actinoplanes sandaracinus]MDI6103961.1 hypothetical protein [Actinoplanes sandaracinus]